MASSARAALGFSVHTGWAAAVAVTRAAGSDLELLQRRRIELLPVAASSRPDAAFVYHAARKLPLVAAEALVRETEQRARTAAAEALDAVVAALRAAGYAVVAASVITGKKRPPRELPAILGSHAAIHAAEGELYRSVLRAASEQLRLGVLEVPAVELAARAAEALGMPADAVPGLLVGLGRALGPPWTADHKAATLAAVVALG